jgi:hypothetical protein
MRMGIEMYCISEARSLLVRCDIAWANHSPGQGHARRRFDETYCYEVDVCQLPLTICSNQCWRTFYYFMETFSACEVGNNVMLEVEGIMLSPL